MRFRFLTCDVFTDVRFGGNPLAVLPEATGLTDGQMQQIAREFNFSECTFVFPSAAQDTWKVRIFTPVSEVPFAGHPNIGTAFVLARIGATAAPNTVFFEEHAGLVPVTVEHCDNGAIWCELRAPVPLSLGRTFASETVASAISLLPGDIVTSSHLPQVASVGLPIVLVQLRDRQALARARPNYAEFERLADQGLQPAYVHAYAHGSDGFDLYTRMFTPLDGVPEDPATGSANCALAALLSQLNSAPDGQFQWRIAQGVEMGRPSVLEARTEKVNGLVAGMWIGGESVLVSEGVIEV